MQYYIHKCICIRFGICATRHTRVAFSLYHPERRISASLARSMRARHDSNEIQIVFLNRPSERCSVSVPLAINITIIHCGRCRVPPSPLTPSQPEPPILLQRRLAERILITQSDVRQRGPSDWLLEGGRWVSWPIRRWERRGLWILITLRNRTPWRLPSNVSVVKRLIFINQACGVVGLEKSEELCTQRETVTANTITQREDDSFIIIRLQTFHKCQRRQ